MPRNDCRTSIPTGPTRGEPLVPHALRIAYPPGTTSFLRQDARGQWLGGGAEDEAFVFPSFWLAQRYAALLEANGHGGWMPVAQPARQSSLDATSNACEACGCTEQFACPDRCAWQEPGLCTACADGAMVANTWAVFKGPLDFPDGYLARRFVDTTPTEEHVVGEDLASVRGQLPPGLGRLPRTGGDDPALLEVWL